MHISAGKLKLQQTTKSETIFLRHSVYQKTDCTLHSKSSMHV